MFLQLKPGVPPGLRLRVFCLRVLRPGYELKKLYKIAMPTHRTAHISRLLGVQLPTQPS